MGVITQGLIRTNDDKRIANHDILVNTDHCRDYIQKGSLDEVEHIMSSNRFDGMVTNNQSVQALVEVGHVNSDQAIGVSLKPNELAQGLRGRD